MKVEIMGTESVEDMRAMLADLKALAMKHNIVIMFQQERTSRGLEYLPEPRDILGDHEITDVLCFSRTPMEPGELTFKVIKNT